MLRGREGKLATVHFAALSAAGTALCFAVAPAAGWICLSLCALLGAIFAAFTRRRYREIRRLSQYLASVYSGGKPLDIRDNREGELSILKNDLYKITCVLTRQAEQLHRDKDYLAEAMQNISHQLKTPLTSLFVMTELLRSPDLPADRREEFWQSTGQSLERIQWLVGTLLKFSRLDAEAVAFAACRMIILNHDALSDMDEDTIEAVYGDGIYNDDHDLDTAVLMENAQVNPMKMLMVLLFALTEPVNHRVHDTEWLGGFYKCIKDDESVYRGIYSALDGIGYEISDMEKSLLDGTHPSYEGAEEES